MGESVAGHGWRGELWDTAVRLAVSAVYVVLAVVATSVVVFVLLPVPYQVGRLLLVPVAFPLSLGIRWATEEAVSLWRARSYFRYSLRRAEQEDARQILESADRDPQVAELVQAEADLIAEHFAQHDWPLRRLTLTAYLNGYIRSITEPGWSETEPAALGYSPARMHIAGICHLAHTRNILR